MKEENKKSINKYEDVNEKRDEPNLKEEKISFWKKIFHTPSKYITISISTVIIILYVLFTSGFNNLIAYQDAFFITSFIWFAGGILSLVSRDGFFRIFSYSGYYVVNKFRQKHVDNYHDYYFNKEATKENKNWSWTPYFFCGLILFMISLTFMIIISVKK